MCNWRSVKVCLTAQRTEKRRKALTTAYPKEVDIVGSISSSSLKRITGLIVVHLCISLCQQFQTIYLRKQVPPSNSQYSTTLPAKNVTANPEFTMEFKTLIFLILPAVLILKFFSNTKEKGQDKATITVSLCVDLVPSCKSRILQT